MAITLRVFGKAELVSKYQHIAADMPSLISATMKNLMVRLADYVRTNKLQGQVLTHRSGTLSRSIQGTSSFAGHTVTGITGSKGVKYAAVHELGGIYDIPSHQRMISKVFGKPVIPHEITIKAHKAEYPQRAYLKPSLHENHDMIVDGLRQAALRAMRAA